MLFTGKGHFMAFSTKLWDIRLTLTLKHTTWPTAFQLKIRSLVFCKMTSCTGQGKDVTQLKTSVNMIWKLIWPWKIKKVMLLWEAHKGRTCWELLTSLNNTWTARGSTSKYHCRCRMGRCFSLYPQSLLYSCFTSWLK